MKIHILNDTFYACQDLQPVADGMYPVYGENEIIANVISSKTGWTIRLSKDYRSDISTESTLDLRQFEIYTIHSLRSRRYYRIIITPNQKLKLFKSQTKSQSAIV